MRTQPGSIISRCIEQSIRKRAADLLHSPETMGLRLQQERERSDRTGTPFCLVVITPLNGGGSIPKLTQLSRIVLGRARLSDDVGWLEEHLCVLLPDTDPTGGSCFARDVRELAMQGGFGVHVTVYGYPNGDNDNDEHGTPAGDAPAPHIHAGRPQPVAHAMRELFVRPTPWWKRSIDIVGSALGMVVLSPLLLLITVAIRLTSRGPAIFTQQRNGVGGRPFVIYKFRTMRRNAARKHKRLLEKNELDGPAFKIKNDPRVTRIGKLLRKTSLDELPQLFNVLKGHMSLVGPRPLPLHEAGACSPWQARREDVSPGLTCTWQVSGRSNITFDQWIRMDIDYIRNRSIFRDLWLLLRTIPAIVRGHGAY